MNETNLNLLSQKFLKRSDIISKMIGLKTKVQTLLKQNLSATQIVLISLGGDDPKIILEVIKICKSEYNSSDKTEEDLFSITMASCLVLQQLGLKKFNATEGQLFLYNELLARDNEIIRDEFNNLENKRIKKEDLKTQVEEGNIYCLSAAQAINNQLSDGKTLKIKLDLMIDRVKTNGIYKTVSFEDLTGLIAKYTKENVLNDGDDLMELKSIGWHMGILCYVYLYGVSNLKTTFEDLFLASWKIYFEKIEIQTTKKSEEKLLNHFQDDLKLKHKAIINYFLNKGFGVNLPILTHFSRLKPIDRCIILEALFDKGVKNIFLYDKMVLAYVKIGRVDYAKQVIEFTRLIGESGLNILNLINKLDVGEAKEISDLTRIAQIQGDIADTNSKEELEFLLLLKQFVLN